MKTPEFDQFLQKYADLTVTVGLNLQPGQRLVIIAPLQAAPLVRLVTAKAYQNGARLVDVLWQDEQLTLIRYQHARRDSFEEYPLWFADALLEYAKRGDAVLNIVGSDPDLLKDQDPELIAIAQRTSARYMKPFSDYQACNALNWGIVSIPVPIWARKVFPDEPPEVQVTMLWNAIFDVCRLKVANPISAWREHIKELGARCAALTERRYQALKFTGPGTDLNIGLLDGHRWLGGQTTSQAGITFTPNLPTEEVFTVPHKEKTDGVVQATKPLSYGGSLIEDFSLTFAEGHVVDVSAASGETILRKLIKTDDGAGRLGEVALVPSSSPISRSGLLFYNTLFDENAASHIALGRGFRTALQGSDSLSNELFEAAGGNYSLVHVDFMIGSDEMDVDGVRKDGAVEPLMRDGEWAFDV